MDNREGGSRVKGSVKAHMVGSSFKKLSDTNTNGNTEPHFLDPKVSKF